MVKRRSGRRANTTRSQSSNQATEDSDTNDSLDPVNSIESVSSGKGPKTIDPYSMSPSKLEGLVSEKSLFVKVVDIQKSNSKVISGVNFNISSFKLDEKSSVKVKSAESGGSVINSLNVVDNMSLNRNKSVVSRVVTRSRRITEKSNTVIDKVTTVGVITRRTSKTTKGKMAVTVINEPVIGSNEISCSDRILEENTDSVVKCESLSQTDDDDPCLSGDIMYEQIIIEDDQEESTSAIKTENEQSTLVETSANSVASSETILENDMYNKPSSTSNSYSCFSENTLQEIERIQAGEDSKVSSSSIISDDICRLDEVLDPERNNVAGSCSGDVSVATTDCQNIQALSSLKLDPGVEPVSSSKTESFFEPIFSIDEDSSEHVSMDVESVESVETKLKEFVQDSTCVSSIEPTTIKTNIRNSPNKLNVKNLEASSKKIMTRSRSVIKPTSKILEKGKARKKSKAEEKNIVVEVNPAECSDKLNNCNAMEADQQSSSVENIKYLKNETIDTNDSDTPLVVNRCITDETRKYMGPKGFIKNNYCNNVDGEGSVEPDSLSKASVTEDSLVSVIKVAEETPFKQQENSAIEDTTASCKEDLLKEESSQYLENIDDVLSCSTDDIKTISCEGSTKTESVSHDESTAKDNIGDTQPVNISDGTSNISVVNVNEAEEKSQELMVRRSRRSSADKAKKLVSSPIVLTKERKDTTPIKVQSTLDTNTSSDKFNKDSLSLLKLEPTSKSAEKNALAKSPKLKPLDKSKKEFITISSILNEKLKPMSPKELIKKSFIANESRAMDPPSSDTKTDKNNFRGFPNQPCTDDNGNDVERAKLNTSSVSSSTENMTIDQINEKKTDLTDKIKLDLKSDNSLANSSAISYDSDKPVKVKSRWRRTSELEMGKIVTSEPMDIDSSSRFSFSEDSKSESESKPSLPEEEKFNNEAIVAQRMNSFIHIDSNEYLTERYVSKETKRMVCDCTLTKEEMAKGEKGCGEDCLNRLLLIECGSRCPLGKQCSNKCFVNRDYTKCKVVNMANKGMGVISAENIPSDQFIMEYVGEVLDPKEFRKRAKEYAKAKIAHFYFMSLKADTVIDATHKGNISRFINHSCDPNAETQKWTVNGELRIGFFSKRPIAVGEEITFDYQLERYGKEAQKCYCGSSKCRGWLGQNPDNDETDDDSDEDSEEWSDEEAEEDKDKLDADKDKPESLEKKTTLSKIKKDKKKLPVRRKEIRDTTFNPDGDLEDEIEKLSLSGVKNQKHTLALSRLIVRATEERSRTRLLDLIKTAATPCLRLFLDYHGLNLLWSWMVDPRSTIKVKVMILGALFTLPIQNKTILKDSKVLSIIEKWASIGDCKTLQDIKERGSTEEENSNSPKEEGKLIEKESLIQEKLDDYKKFDAINDSTSNDIKIDTETETPERKKDIMNQANKLLEDWANLKEEFRIPRKQRVEQMKEHERQADMEYSDPRENQSYNRRRFRDRKESRFDKVRDSRFDSKKEEWNNQWQNQQMGKMSKAERRQLFAERVKREEREKKEAEELWKSHQEQCQALGVNPSQTAMFHPHLNALAFYHKESNSWMPYQEGAESYGGGDGGVVVDHHQPPPPYQIDYQSQLPPSGPGYYQPGYQPAFGQFNQALLFQPPPPPPPQQFNVPPLPQHQPQPLPPPYQPPLAPGQPFPPGYVLPQGPPLIQPGPLIPPHGPLPPHHGPPLPLQACAPIGPQHGPPIPPPHGPLPPHGPPIPPQLCPPLPSQSVPPIPQQQGLPPIPPQGHQTFFPGPPLQGPVPPHPAVLPQTSPSPHLPLPSVHSVPPQSAPPPLPSSTLNNQPPPQQGPYNHESSNSMEVQAFPTEQLNQISSVPLKLPPKWKTAKDKEGRLYYYHVKKRVSQWIFPYAAAAAAFNSEPTSDSSSDDSSLSSSEEEDDEEEEEEEDSSEVEQENTAPTDVRNEVEEIELDGDSGSAKKRKVKKDDVESPVQIKKARESSLVSTILIPREEAAEVAGITRKKIRDNKEKVKREKARAARKQRHQTALQVSGTEYSSVSASVSSKCEADTSSGPKRKIKDIFMLKMANVVVASLNQYRKHDCKVGRITSTKDFKALAKKLTHFIMVKELRHCVNVEDLDCNENVKHKARDFIRKYMSKFGPVYVNPKED